MAKQDPGFKNKLSSRRAARASKSSARAVRKRALELVAFQRKQLKGLGEYFDRLNLALARSIRQRKGN